MFLPRVRRPPEMMFSEEMGSRPFWPSSSSRDGVLAAVHQIRAVELNRGVLIFSKQIMQNQSDILPSGTYKKRNISTHTKLTHIY